MSDALFDVPTAPPVEPYSCTGQPHEHRWLRFGPLGQRDEVQVFVDADGHVDCSEQALAVLLRDAGYQQQDPDAVETRTRRLRDRLHARLLATIPGRNTQR